MGALQEVHASLTALGFDADNLTAGQAAELLHLEHHMHKANEEGL